eukprot:SAG31_NODE_5260_length_2645_cov_1.747054_3_plen_128_part_01
MRNLHGAISARESDAEFDDMGNDDGEFGDISARKERSPNMIRSGVTATAQPLVRGSLSSAELSAHTHEPLLATLSSSVPGTCRPSVLVAMPSRIGPAPASKVAAVQKLTFSPRTSGCAQVVCRTAGAA